MQGRAYKGYVAEAKYQGVQKLGCRDKAPGLTQGCTEEPYSGKQVPGCHDKQEEAGEDMVDSTSHGPCLRQAILDQRPLALGREEREVRGKVKNGH